MTFERWVWLLVAFSVFYFGGHLTAYGLRHDPALIYPDRAERVALCVHAGYSPAECAEAHDENGDR